MNCTECGIRMIDRSPTARAPFHYKASGLDNVFLYGVAVRVCPTCKAEAPVIPRIGELHRVIADTLSRKPAPLSGEEIRYLRKNIGIPQGKMATILGIAPETLSRVENGKLPLRPGLEHLVRIMARRAAGSETVREAVLEVADQLDRQGSKKVSAGQIRLTPDSKGGWKSAA